MHDILLPMDALGFTEKTAYEAGELLLTYFNRSGLKTNIKADRTVVTEADLASDHLIAKAIREHYPQDLIMSEELNPHYPKEAFEPLDTGELRAVWVVDPLDGTTNFSMGLHFWGVLIARLVAGRPVTAALYFPLIQEMYTAQSGQGAFLNGEPIHVQPPVKDKPMAFFTCCSRTHRRYTIEVPYKSRILGSAAYSFCAVARGVAVLGFEATPKIWDIAAGWLLVEEAGGQVESWDDSQPFPLNHTFDYARHSFPTLSTSSEELRSQALNWIKPRA